MSTGTDLNAFIENRRRSKNINLAINIFLAIFFISILTPSIFFYKNAIYDFFEIKFGIGVAKRFGIWILAFVILSVFLVCRYVLRRKVFDEKPNESNPVFIECIINSNNHEVTYTYFKKFRTIKLARRHLSEIIDMSLSSFRWIDNYEVTGTLENSKGKIKGFITYKIHYYTIHGILV